MITSAFQHFRIWYFLRIKIWQHGNKTADYLSSFELAKFPFVSHIGYPLLQLLINMSEAVEPAVPDVRYFTIRSTLPFVLALRGRPARGRKL